MCSVWLANREPLFYDAESTVTSTDDQRINKLLDRISKVCPVPETVHRVMMLAARDDVDVRELADAIAADPGLAVETMRVANSAVYRRTEPVDNLTQAVFVLGMSQVHSMASAIAVMSAFRGDHRLSRQLNDWAVVAGTLGGLLATELGTAEKGAAYLSGLLCEVGAMACLIVDSRYADLWEQAGGSWGRRADLERQHYGPTTWEIGSRVLERNRLPPSIVIAVGTTCDTPPTDFSPLGQTTLFSRLAAPEISGAPNAADLSALEGRLRDLAELACLEDMDGKRLVGLAEWALDSAAITLQQNRRQDSPLRY